MTPEDTYQLAAFWIAVVVCAGAFVVAGAALWTHFGADWRIEILKNHYPAVVGLPAAATAAFN